jgi:hypothetical protein
MEVRKMYHVDLVRLLFECEFYFFTNHEYNAFLSNDNFQMTFFENLQGKQGLSFLPLLLMQRCDVIYATTHRIMSEINGCISITPVHS